MEAVKKSTRELADFIYRDSQRIASLTAQIFGNALLNTEITQAKKDASEKGVGLATIVTGAMKSGTEDSLTEKNTYQPHDAAAAGLLTNLALLGRISDKPASARPGEIVRAAGTLYLFDGNLVRLSMSAVIPTVFGAAPDADPGLLAGLQAFIGMLPMPAGFVLRTPDSTIAGTIDANGLHEPISAAYFKHGADGIAEAGIVGILEGTGGTGLGDTLGSALLDGAQGLAKVFRDLLFPAGSIRLAPIAIYRSVH